LNEGKILDLDLRKSLIIDGEKYLTKDVVLVLTGPDETT